MADARPTVVTSPILRSCGRNELSSSRVRVTVLMAQKFMPTEAGSQAHSLARVRSSRTWPLSKKIGGPA